MPDSELTKEDFDRLLNIFKSGIGANIVPIDHFKSVLFILYQKAYSNLKTGYELVFNENQEEGLIVSRSAIEAMIAIYGLVESPSELTGFEFYSDMVNYRDILISFNRLKKDLTDNQDYLINPKKDLEDSKVSLVQKITANEEFKQKVFKRPKDFKIEYLDDSVWLSRNIHSSYFELNKISSCMSRDSRFPHFDRHFSVFYNQTSQLTHCNLLAIASYYPSPHPLSGIRPKLSKQLVTYQFLIFFNSLFLLLEEAKLVQKFNDSLNSEFNKLYEQSDLLLEKENARLISIVQ